MHSTAHDHVHDMMKYDHRESCPALDHSVLEDTEALKWARPYWSVHHMAEQPRVGVAGK